MSDEERVTEGSCNEGTVECGCHRRAYELNMKQGIGVRNISCRCKQLGNVCHSFARNSYMSACAPTEKYLPQGYVTSCFQLPMVSSFERSVKRGLTRVDICPRCIAMIDILSAEK